MPTMKSGDILGHEFMGEVVEVGSPSHKLKKGDRIVVPFNINCGECWQCKLGNYAVCQRLNRNAKMAAEQFGYNGGTVRIFAHDGRLLRRPGGVSALENPAQFCRKCLRRRYFPKTTAATVEAF
ncbi:threonine dehydrogenase-like Zn-dependent dehydrogenase [Bradyrhizobium sp. S3.12.5]